MDYLKLTWHLLATWCWRMTQKTKVRESDMADCEFLVRVRHKAILPGVGGFIVESCGLTGKACLLVDVSPANCTRRTWAMSYLSKQEALKTRAEGLE
jgi:hypothetical protein